MYLTLICEILKELSVHVRDTFSGETAIKQTIKNAYKLLWLKYSNFI